LSFVDWSIVDLHSGGLVRKSSRIERASLSRLAIAFTSAAAIGGLVEVLVDRIASPAMVGVLGSSATTAISAVTWVGTLAVSVTAILVLLAVFVRAALAKDRHRVFAVAALIAVVATVMAGLVGGTSLIFVHLSVSVAAVACLAMSVRRASVGYSIALWAVTLAVVAGQWSLTGLGIGPTIASRAVGEAALVLAVVLFALAVFRSSRHGLASLLGLVAGGGIALVSLASDQTPLVALWATGVMLWLPSLAYVVAAAAAGYLLVTWLSDRTTRYLAAGLVLLLVAGVEPTLVHHSVTALLALVTLGAKAPMRGELSWQ
jgi:hypothetical protein